MGAMAGDTPSWPEGPLALPGVYTVKLTVDGTSYTQTVTVKNDPRSPASAADVRAQHDLQIKVGDSAALAWTAYQQVAAMRAAVNGAAGANPPADVAAAIKTFEDKLTGAGGTVGGGRRGGGPGPGANTPPPPPNFVGVNAAFLRHLETLDSGDMAPNEPMLHAYAAVCGDLRTALESWRKINDADLAALNAVLSKSGRGVTAASPLPAPVCPAAPSGRKKS